MTSYAWSSSTTTAIASPVPSLANLPASGAVIGQLCVTQDTGNIYEWNGTSWQSAGGGGGAGDVVGPGSAVDGQLAEFNGTSGKLIKAVTRTISTTAPITGGGDLSADRTIAMAKSTGSVDGYLAATDFATFAAKQPAGNYVTGLTGDVTATGPGSVAATIAAGAVTPAKLGTVTDGVTLDQSGTGSTLEVKAGGIANTQISATAAIALTKLAALTISRALTTNASGVITVSPTTDTEIGYVSGVTSSIQTQLNGKQATGSYITALTGDVTAAGPGSSAATIAAGAVTNAKIAAAAGISVNKLAALTGNKAVASDASGFLTASTTTDTELGFVSGVTSSIQTQLNATEKTANKGAANGYCPLDASSKIPVAYLSSVVMTYQGSWDPTTNTPTLSDGTGTNGSVYYVSAARSAAISGLTDPSMANFQVGELVIYSSSIGKWQLVTPAAGVSFVNGAQGSVTVNAINQLTSDVTTAAASGSQSLAATIAAGAVTNTKIAAAAGISLSKLAALTANKAVVSDVSGFLVPSTTTDTEIGYVSGVTSAIQTQINAKVASTRAINTTAPITGGGNLSADRTIAIAKATSAVDGYLAATDFTTFAAKVSATRTINTTAPLTGGGDLSTDRTIAIAKATGSVDGYLAATDFATFAAKQPAGSYITALTGDVTATGPGSVASSIAAGAVTPAKLGTITDGITLDQSGTGSTLEVKAGGIANTQINATAAISVSKLAAGTNTYLLQTVAGVPTWSPIPATSDYAPNTTVAVSSNVTLTDRAIHFVDTSAARSLTLPSPGTSKMLVIKDISGLANTNTIGIGGGGANVEGSTATYILDSNYGSWSFVSDGSAWWII